MKNINLKNLQCCSSETYQISRFSENNKILYDTSILYTFGQDYKTGSLVETPNQDRKNHSTAYNSKNFSLCFSSQMINSNFPKFLRWLDYCIFISFLSFWNKAHRKVQKYIFFNICIWISVVWWFQEMEDMAQAIETYEVTERGVYLPAGDFCDFFPAACLPGGWAGGDRFSLASVQLSVRAGWLLLPLADYPRGAC